MEHIWRLAVAVFMIAIATFLMLFGYAFQGSTISTVALWLSLGLILFGVTKGLLTIVDYHEQHRGQKEE